MTEKYRKFLDLVVYQVYPKSFLDTNGDGVGDLKGIEQKLDYISSLGANAIWICPIYKSPQCDNGYDISDYREIDERYGTMEDFENLVISAKKKGIKIIMDLVANHTSSEHEWFKQARASKSNPYHEYYYWSDKPRNDWQSVFGGSAWEYNAPTNEYYLHSFAIGQPDVNWENPKVRKEFCDIVDFWLEKGVDGFRCDVLDFISKDFEKGKMYNGPHFHEYVKELFGREKVKDIFTVGECETDEKTMQELCGEGRDELKCSFQFEHLDVGRKNKYEPAPHSFSDVANVLKKWQGYAEKYDLLYTLLTDNHDQSWFNSRVGNDKENRYESTTALALLVYGMKGIPFIYQGQEIGSANSYFDDIAMFDDVETLNFYRENKGKYSQKELLEKINYGGRDITRRPFAWSSEKNYGFTDGERPWLPFASRSDEINLERDISLKKSVFAFYRKLFGLRKENLALRYGSFKDVTNGRGFIAYEREYAGEKYLIVCNFEKETRLCGYGKGITLLSNFGLCEGEKTEIDRTYSPYACALFKV